MNDEEVTPVVVVFRRQHGEDLVGILISADDENVKIESPHTVHINYQTGTMGILPYCILSDEKYFTFKKSDIVFLVTANERVTNGYLSMVHLSNFEELSKVLNHPDVEFDPIDRPITPGNDTRH